MDWLFRQKSPVGSLGRLVSVVIHPTPIGLWSSYQSSFFTIAPRSSSEHSVKSIKPLLLHRRSCSTSKICCAALAQSCDTHISVNSPPHFTRNSSFEASNQDLSNRASIVGIGWMVMELWRLLCGGSSARGGLH